MRLLATQLLLVFLFVSQAYAIPTSLSFNGNISGTANISSLSLTAYSGSCNLYTQVYGTTPIDIDGNFSVTLDSSGTYLGNANGAAYTSLSDIFDVTNSNIIGLGGCNVNGTTAAWSITVTVNGTTLSGSVPVNAFPFALNAMTSLNTRALNGIPLQVVAPANGQVLQYNGTGWAPATISAGAVNSVSTTSPLSSTGGTNPVISLQGLASLGTVNQLLGMNAAGTGFEYKTVNGNNGISIVNGGNSVTVASAGELSALNALATVGFVRRDGVASYSTQGAFDLVDDTVGTLPINRGGTNSVLTLNNNRIMISSGGSIVEHTALTDSLPMRTNAAGLPTTGSTDIVNETTGTLTVGRGGTGTTNGSITGTGVLTMSAATSQNIILMPGSAANAVTVPQGLVGIGTSNPSTNLHVYQAANAPTQVNIGVTGTGALEYSALNLMTRSGTASALGTAGVKGYRISGRGDSYPGFNNEFNIDWWDGLSEQNLMAMNQSLATLRVPLEIASNNANPYASSGFSDYRPEGVSSNLVNSATGSGVGAFNMYSVNSQNAYIGAVSHSVGNTPHIVIGHQTSTLSYDERMRIDQTGRVGIGTPSPATKLDVNGTIKSRVINPSCSSGCSNLSMSIDMGNHILARVGGGSITMGTSNASLFMSYPGVEFTFTVCGVGGTSIAVNFVGVTAGFASGVSWSNVPASFCTTQKFVIMDNGGTILAHPVSPSTTYSLL